MRTLSGAGGFPASSGLEGAASQSGAATNAAQAPALGTRGGALRLRLQLRLSHGAQPGALVSRSRLA